MSFVLTRNYRTEKACRLCANPFTPSTNGPQVYCDPCRTVCRVDGCSEVVRAGGLCSAHSITRFEVAIIPQRNGGLCGIEGCDRKSYARGHCNLHYQRVNRYGSIGAVGITPRAITGVRCSVDGCDKIARGGGLCITHYARKQKFGDPGGAKLLRAAMGEGSVTETGYRIVVVDGDYVYEHRHNMEKKIGRKLRSGENVHHMDGDRLNNDPANLELWSVYQPSGQRVADKVRAAIKVLREHPELAADEGVRLLSLESQESSEFLANEDTDFASALLRGILAC